MKLICLQENLKNGLNAVSGIISRNLILPILNNILFETQKGRLKISATNLEIGVNCWISGKIEKEGKITIPAKPIILFVNNLPNDKIELEVKNDSLILKSGNYKTIFKGLSADEFPIIPKLEEEIFCVLPAENLKRSLNQVVNITSISELRPEISGILFNFIQKELKLAATDSFRLVEKNIFNIQNTSLKSVIIPQKTIQELIKLISQFNADVKIILNSNQILFDLDNAQLISRLIDGKYPDYEQFMPKDFIMQIILNKEEFLNLIKTAGIFSGKNDIIKIIIDPIKNILEVFAEDANLGENQSYLPIEISCKNKNTEKIEINFNYKYLIDGLINSESQKIIIGVNDSLSPVVIKNIDNNNYTYLVMPIKS